MRINGSKAKFCFNLSSNIKMKSKINWEVQSAPLTALLLVTHDSHGKDESPPLF